MNAKTKTRKKTVTMLTNTDAKRTGCGIAKVSMSCLEKINKF